MAEFKFVINDSKTGKSYKKALEDESLLGKRIGEKVSGEFLGLEGYELEIRGGTDFAGFPMRGDVSGRERKKALLGHGVGIKIKRAGMKRRKTICGNILSSTIAQVNLKVTKQGAKPLEEIFAAPVAEEAKAE